MKLNKKQYNLNKIAKVGETIICPSCGTSFIKTNYQQVFCKSKTGTICKDYYWNNVTPTKKNNTTRISPASKAFLIKKHEENYYNEHPFSSEGLGQWCD